jgi:hypothetical protein
MDTSIPNSVVEQARLELSIAAAAAERANRPRALVWLAALLVAGASVALVMALSARTKESLRLGKARDAALSLEKQKAELDALTAQVRSRGLEPDPRMAATLEAMATVGGLQLQGGISDTADGMGNLPGGMMRKVYTARVAPGQDPAAIMNWLSATQDPQMIKWLEISQLRFSPANAAGKGALGGMNVEVKFSRYEKK